MTYPVQSEEYGTYGWLRREVGGFLGFGYDEATWKHDQHGQVDSIIQSGYMQMLQPPPLPRVEHKPANTPHRWSFLTPLARLSIVDGETLYDLPEDFSGVLGEFTVVV